MFDTHKYAFSIETTTIAIFKCDKGGLGGIADADFIEKNPFIAIVTVLGNFYNKVGVEFKNRIDNFIEDYHLEIGKSIEEIGEEKIREIIKDFNEIIKTI